MDDVRPVPGHPDVHLVDNYLFDNPGALATYLVTGEHPAILDAGAANTVGRIEAAMDAIGMAPEAVETIVLSHVHLDHAGGAARLAERCPNAEVLVHERGYPYVTEEAKLDRLTESVEAAVGMTEPYGDPGLVPESRCRALTGGETLGLGDRRMDTYDTPGHAPHQISLHDPADGLLFAADAVGAYHAPSTQVAPSTPPPSFDLEANLETIERLRALDPERILYCHFGPGKDAAAELDAYAEVLPAFVAAVKEAAERHGEDIAAIVADLESEWPSPTLQRDVVGVLRASP
jgi:glyoxylase-like metal-dependent hydrolase (beta-lactamase superfamily II)